MGKKLEMLTTLSAARTMRWEESTSKNGPTTEQLLGALGLAQRDNPIGIAILSAKHMQCAHSIKKLHSHIQNHLLFDLSAKQCEHGSYILVADTLNLPIDVMQKRIVGAWRRYSMRGERARKSMDSLKRAVKSMERAINLKETQKEIAFLEEQIASHRARIDTEARLLDEYAHEKAASSCKCPRCRATGVIQKTNRLCDTCAGVGEFRTTEDDWVKSFVAAGAMSTTALKWTWPNVAALLRKQRDVLRSYELDAIMAIEKRINAEFECEN